MIKLDLDTLEQKTLIEALENYLSDLSVEIADTDRFEFREALKAQRNVLNKILSAAKEAREED